MYKLQGIGWVDEPSRNGIKISLEAMLNGYSHCWNKPTISNFGHDRTKPIGYSKVQGIYLEPGKAYAPIVTYIAETKEEQETINKYANYKLTQGYIEGNETKIEELENLIKDKLTENAVIAPVNAVAFYDKGIVERVLPDLYSKIDEDGLIDIGELERISGINGVYKVGKFIVFANEYFRRNLSIVNTLNRPLLARLEELQRLKELAVIKTNRAESILNKNKKTIINPTENIGGDYDSKIFTSEIRSSINENLSIKLALDLNIIGVAGTEKNELEFQYWFGPKFNDDLSSIPEGVARQESTEIEYNFSNIKSTDFYWYKHDDKQTFECEEIIDKPNVIESFKNYCGCRYVHSIINPETKLPMHLDGAIRAYTEEQLIQRLDLNLDKVERTGNYTKLWKIDGDFPIPLWKELITHFYRDNTLIGQYFDGKDSVYDEIVKKENVIEIEGKERRINQSTLSIKDFIPVILTASDGIRVFFNFIDNDEIVISDNADIQVNSNAYYSIISTNKQININIMETDTITLLKLIKKEGFSVAYDNISLVDFGDTVYNFPAFYCKDITAASAVQKIMSILCKIWSEKNDDRLISYSIYVKTENDKPAYHVSFAGHVNDFYKVFKELEENYGSSDFMPKVSDVGEWINRVYLINSKIFQNVKNNPYVFDLLKNGELNFPRAFIPEDEYKVEISSKGVNCSFQASEDSIKMITEYKIKPAHCFLVKNTLCSKCKGNYRDCSCIKFQEKNVCEEIHPQLILGLFWTNRSAWQ